MGKSNYLSRFYSCVVYLYPKNKPKKMAKSSASGFGLNGSNCVNSVSLMNLEKKPQERDNPQSQYLKVRPSTLRYRLLVALARKNKCTWQQVARYAIDLYLDQNFPKQV